VPRAAGASQKKTPAYRTVRRRFDLRGQGQGFSVILDRNNGYSSIAIGQSSSFS
jgi:hypothetical protein